MVLKKYIPFYLTIALVLGILAEYYVGVSLKLTASFLIISFILLLIAFLVAKKKLKQLLFLPFISIMVFFFIGVFNTGLQKGENQRNHYLNAANIGSEKIIVKVRKVLKPNRFYSKYEAQIQQLENVKVTGKILLNVARDSISNNYNVDDILLIKSKISSLSRPKNPHQFDYKEYLKKNLIYGQISTNQKNILVLDSNYHTVKGFAHLIRSKVENSLVLNNFKGEEFSIIKSLLLGQRQEISDELIESYTKAGAIHILAISGLHIGIILLFLNFIFKPIELINNGKSFKLLLIIIFLWLFAFVAGLSASVIRAVTMFTAVAVSLIGNRKRNIYHSLIISVFFLLLLNPFYLFDVGFQLSYFAVFFIVWLQPILEQFWNPKFKILRYFWNLFTVSLAAQIGVLPLSLYYFHQFPALFFVTNMVIIPFLGLILGFGILIIILSVLNLLPHFIAKFYEIIIYLMNTFITWIANHESFLFKNIFFPISFLVLTYLLIISCSLFLKRKTAKLALLTLISIVTLQIAFIYNKWKAETINQTIIFNKNRSSLIVEKKGTSFYFFSTDSLSEENPIVKTMLQNNFTEKSLIKNNINSANFYQKELFVIDSLGVYSIPKLLPKKILLMQSPKINLERLIYQLKPKLIIADNSNYISYVKLWEKTCLENNVLFHYTNKDGAFTLHY